MAFIISDLNLYNPKVTPRLYDLDATQLFLFNLFNTSPGERLFDPEYGVPLEDSLFEVIDDITSFQIYNIIYSSVRKYLPFLEIDTTNTKITPNPEENSYQLDMYFTIPSIGTQAFNFQGNFVPSKST